MSCRSAPTGGTFSPLASSGLPLARSARTVDGMHLSLSDADLAFQREVRAFLDDKLTEELRAAGRACSGIFCDRPVAQRWCWLAAPTIRALHRPDCWALGPAASSLPVVKNVYSGNCGRQARGP